MTAHVRGTCFPTARVSPYICVYNKERTLPIDRTHCTNTVHNNTSNTGGCKSPLPHIYSHALRSAQGGSLAVICAQIRKVTGTNKTSEKNKQPPVLRTSRSTVMITSRMDYRFASAPINNQTTKSLRIKTRGSRDLKERRKRQRKHTESSLAASHQAFSGKDKRMSTQIHRKVGVSRKSNVIRKSTSTQSAKIPLRLFEQRRRRHP